MGDAPKISIKVPLDLEKLGINSFYFVSSGNLFDDHQRGIRDQLYKKMALAFGRGSTKLMDYLEIDVKDRDSKKSDEWIRYFEENRKANKCLQYIEAFCCEQIRNHYTEEMVKCDSCGRWRRIWKDCAKKYRDGVKRSNKWSCRDHPDGDISCETEQEYFVLPSSFYKPGNK